MTKSLNDVCTLVWEISTGMANQVYEPCSVVNAAGFTVCPAPDFALLFFAEAAIIEIIQNWVLFFDQILT